MRLLTRKQFLKMPEGTIYTKGRPIYFNGFCVKHQTMQNDWLYTDYLFFECDSSDKMDGIFDDMMLSGKSVPMNTSASRDGYFDHDDIFLVYEPDDLLVLLGVITNALNVKEQTND